jgi:hypothetical protein
LAIIAGTSLLALLAHLIASRELDLDVTTAMAVACVAGAVLGVALGTRISQRSLGRGFAALVVAVAVYLVASVAFLGGPPSI